MKELHQVLEEVKDEVSFLAFVKALIADREPHEGGDSITRKYATWAAE